MATIRVRGQAVAPGSPDEVVVTLSLSAERDRPELAYDEVAERRGLLEAVFDELGIDSSARSTAGVAVHPQRAYGPDGRLEDRGYVATTRVLVRVQDAAIVSRLLREAVTRTQADVSGPWWRLAEDNPAPAEARRRAAVDARRRAETYAEALGCRLGQIVAVREPRPEPHERVRGLSVMGEASPEIVVDAGDLDVQAVVDVTFELEQP